MFGREFVFLREQCHRFAHMQDADNLIDLAIMDQQFVVVAGGELMLDFFNGHGQIERFDLRARRHHVFDCDAFEIKQIKQNTFVFERNKIAAFEHH